VKLVSRLISAGLSVLGHAHSSGIALGDELAVGGLDFLAVGAPKKASIVLLRVAMSKYYQSRALLLR